MYIPDDTLRRSFWISSVLAGLLVLGVALTRPALKWLIQKKAAERGFVLEVGELSFGAEHLALQGVELSAPNVPGLRAQFDRLELGWSVRSPYLRSVTLLGGDLRLQGPYREVIDQLQTLRSQGSKAPGSSPSSGGRTRQDVIRDLNLSWSEIEGPESRFALKGVQYDSGNEGHRLGAKSGVFLHAQGQGRAAAAQLELRRREGGFDLNKAEVAELELMVRGLPGVENLLAPEAAKREPQAPKEPQAAAAKKNAGSSGSSANQPGGASAEEEPNGLATKLQPHPQRVLRLQQALQLIRTKLAHRLPVHSQVGKLMLSVRTDDGRLELGPARVDLKRDGKKLELDVQPALPKKESASLQEPGQTLSLHAELPIETALGASIKMQGGPLSLASLGVQEGDWGFVGVRDVRLQGRLNAQLAADAQTITGAAELSIAHLSLRKQKLAERVVHIPPLLAKAKARISVDGTSIELPEWTVSMGDAQFQGDFSVARQEESVLLEANLRAPLVSCQDLVRSAPTALLGDVAQMRFDGTFSLSAGVTANSDDLSKMDIRWNFHNDCKITSLPPALDPYRFMRRFTLEVLGEGGYPMNLEFGPDTGRWISYEEMSPYLEKALLVTEDGRFYRHRGFDDRAIEGAIRANTKAGRFVRGASTISMQLAKNLYLSREKRLARKLQEAAFTLLLEQKFSKKQILEVYLNVIEFGPGVYGIADAARYYFDTTPDKLSITEAFFLASILPAPNRSYFDEEKMMREGRLKYLRFLMTTAEKRGRLTPSELEEALLEEPRFGESIVQGNSAEQSAFDGGFPSSTGSLVDIPLDSAPAEQFQPEYDQP
ncbi:MAG: monofunctional biosynthetic peptidoglycan transglycosylase [Polyangiaceae bacterium]|nr:monofunctional biosynthetic peptidoglycan transglycosylase [Polyangiaceae bacterium]